MSPAPSSAGAVGLGPSHVGRIRAADAGEAEGKRTVVCDSVLEDREVDGPFLLRLELAGRHPSTANQRPRQMIQCGSVVARDVSQEQAPAHWNRSKLLDYDCEAMSLRVVLGSEGS
jgi:hypothetical protein